jgi:hypothetical protein
VRCARQLRNTVRIGLVVAALAIVAARAASAPISASYAASAKNAASVFQLTAAYAPTSLTGSAVGNNVAMSWSPGVNGDGYQISGAANGASRDCSATVVSQIATTTTTSFSDIARSSPQGSWYCYQAQTTLGPWTSVQNNPRVAVQIGVVVTAASFVKGGASGRLGSGDQFVLSFNQPIATASGPSAANTVCATSSGSIVLGAVAISGTCSAGESNVVGVLSGGSNNSTARWSATYSWSTDAKTLTITVGSRITGTNPTSTSGTWTLTPTSTATALLSATGSVHVCSTANAGEFCRAVATGQF